MNFDLKEAIKIANQALLTKIKRNLTDVGIIVLTGAWNREEYDQIAAQHQYATSYLSQDIAPKLWKTLSEALGEKVKKNNFKQALKRHWEQQISPENNQIDQALNTPIIQPKIADNLPATTKPEFLIPDFYVDRPPIESICYETLLQPGSLIRIKAPTLMGKTYLSNRVLAQIAEQNCRIVSFSLELADKKTHFTDLDRFLRWFCLNLSRELRLPNQLNEYWDEEGMGSKVSCTTYLENYLLAQANSPLVLCLDDVDLLFPYPEVYEDFFGLLRSWYEKARSRPNWKKLRLVIIHATDVYIRLNINQSPFNVGLPIELSEFNSEQVQEFARQYGLKEDPILVELLMQIVGGHPYLLEKTFSHLRSHPEMTLAQILAEAPTESGIYGKHLREHWLNLEQHPELAEAIKKVVTANYPILIEPIPTYQLQSLGLVKLSGNKVEPRCSLYRQYFRTLLSSKNGYKDKLLE